MSQLNKVIREVLNKVGFILLSWRTHDKKFSIISNDCYGGEVYKALRLPFNTPFIGLMLMGPCFIKFLTNPHYYLGLELQFINHSVYESCNQNRNEKPYPLAKLDDIEIHFLHYENAETAVQKWNIRKQRINWNNIRICYTVDKDYSTEKELKLFYQLPYKNIVTFSKRRYQDSPNNFVIKKFNTNALALFRESLSEFNFCGWLNGKSVSLNNFKEKAIAMILKKTINM